MLEVVQLKQVIFSAHLVNVDQVRRLFRTYFNTQSQVMLVLRQAKFYYLAILTFLLQLLGLDAHLAHLSHNAGTLAGRVDQHIVTAADDQILQPGVHLHNSLPQVQAQLLRKSIQIPTLHNTCIGDCVEAVLMESTESYTHNSLVIMIFEQQCAG